LAYSAGRHQESELVAGAQKSAIVERAQRGRTEVTVEHLAGDPWFGIWKAASVASSSHRLQSYKVHIRSLGERKNYCTCPDWISNQLGTCKHIEAVLHKLEKKRKSAKAMDASPPLPFAFLSWDSPNGPVIRVHRGADITAELETLLERYFDNSGVFSAELPDAFFRFGEEVAGRDDFLLGDDARLHAQQLASDAASELRGLEIHRRILDSGNQLDGVDARFFPYQVEGVAFLASRGRAVLADDMGLGKTLQAIAAAAWLQQNKELRRVLVICPASLKHQWAREIERFTDLSAQVVQGGPETRQAQYRKENTFAIVNYELIMRDLSVINEILKPDLLILDEAQRIKNWRTKTAACIKLISSRYAFVLSGTPLENRLEDLYSLLQVIDHRVLGPLWRFMVDFHVSDDRGKVIGYRNLSELRRRLAPVMLRRDRTLVLEQLPARTQVRLDVPMTDKQRELHGAAMMAAGTLAKIAKRRPLTPGEQNRLMAALQQARMACDAAELVDPEMKGSPKLEELEGLLEDLCLQAGLKVVVFSQWERMTALVEEIVRRLGIGSVRLHGGVPTGKRGDLLDRFRDDDGVQVFISTDAGGVGLNLQLASALVNLDMPWNPAVLDQRIARVHRLGQTNKVQIFLMIAEDSYEERVAALVQNKRDLFDNVVDPEATEDVVGISKRQLESLIEDLDPETPKRLQAPGVDDQAAPESVQPDDAVTSRDESRQEHGAGTNADVSQCIVDIQGAYGSRVEQILGFGGGLVVVIDRVDAEDEAKAEAFSATVPVALLDPRALASLRRLGTGSPFQEMTSHYGAAQDTPAERINPLQRIAREKLRAAEVLLEQEAGNDAVALELLASSMVSVAAAAADREETPRPDELAVWVYSDALPKGQLTPDQATALLRASSLSQSPSVPPSLLREVLADARQFVQQFSAGT
jgi:superfamily II DNA or RNA helicase